VLYDEIDYINEGRNADRFRRNFRDTPWVRTPVVHWEFSSPRVLTLEYLPGAESSRLWWILLIGYDKIQFKVRHVFARCQSLLC
jgi:predicted unusual protein kinase regulating ubiquinone biosynthesis (AarF/ABC1/UbiB family)